MKEPVQSIISKSSSDTQSFARASEPMFDVAIIGAGISGINTAYRVQNDVGSQNYVVLEGRDEVGGTWSFFKYPGLRSDSDLFTFGFPWRPWRSSSPIATADNILKYIKDSVAESGIDKHIRFNHKVTGAEWSTPDQLWKLTVTSNGSTKLVEARSIVFATGYYHYDDPLKTVIPGIENFKDQKNVIHPQFWPEGFDYSGKNVVIIGSGATAITMLPVLTDKAKKVTMLQRSPSYILSLPNSQRSLAGLIDAVLPRAIAYRMHRTFYLFVPYLIYYFCRIFPFMARTLLQAQARFYLGGKTEIDPHFQPTYDPWDQRLCLCPDADFFKALQTDKADVVTAHIKEVKADHIELEDGSKLPADVIITATGLRVHLGGGIIPRVDGKEIVPSKKLLWRGIMLQDIPNAFFVIGYTNASWTLGADATAVTLARLIGIMNKKKATSATPRVSDALSKSMVRKSPLELKSTYIKAAITAIPQSGDRGPWKPRWNYFIDIWKARWANLEDGIVFVSPVPKQ